MKAWKTCAWILVPMVGAALVERLFHRFGDPETKIVIAGCHVHHLFFGILLALPAAFALAFETEHSRLRTAALAALGLGSGLILDEFVGMIATDMSTPAYLGPVSLGGAAVSVAAFSVLLVGLAAVRSTRTPSGRSPSSRRTP